MMTGVHFVRGNEVNETLVGTDYLRCLVQTGIVSRTIHR